MNAGTLEVVDRDLEAVVPLDAGPAPVVPGIRRELLPVSAATSRAIPGIGRQVGAVVNVSISRTSSPTGSRS